MTGLSRIAILCGLASMSFGCVTTRSLQLAEPVGVGNVDASLEMGVDTLPALNGGDSLVVPTMDVALRYGVSDRTDFTFRTGGAGTEAGLKRAFVLDKHFKLAGEARLGMRPRIQEVPIFQATVGGVLQYSPIQRLHLLFAPNVTMFAVGRPPEALPYPRYEGHFGSPALPSQNTDLVWVPYASVGAGFDVHPAARVIFEVTAPVVPDFVRRAGALPLSTGIALQWRPREAQPSWVK